MYIFKCHILIEYGKIGYHIKGISQNDFYGSLILYNMNKFIMEFSICRKLRKLSHFSPQEGLYMKGCQAFIIFC